MAAELWDFPCTFYLDLHAAERLPPSGGELELLVGECGFVMTQSVILIRNQLDPTRSCG